MGHGGDACKRTPAVAALDTLFRTFLATTSQHAKAVPGRENMFHIAACPPGVEQRDSSTVGTEGIVVVLHNCSLRDRWLQALEAAGMRVDATGWHPAAGSAEKTRTPPVFFGHSFEPPPVRWLH